MLLLLRCVRVVRQQSSGKRRSCAYAQEQPVRQRSAVQRALLMPCDRALPLPMAAPPSAVVQQCMSAARCSIRYALPAAAEKARHMRQRFTADPRACVCVCARKITIWGKLNHLCGAEVPYTRGAARRYSRGRHEVLRWCVRARSACARAAGGSQVRVRQAAQRRPRVECVCAAGGEAEPATATAAARGGSKGVARQRSLKDPAR